MSDIKDPKYHAINPEEATPGPSHRRHGARRIVGIVMACLGALLLLIVALLTGVTFWLTPERLSDIAGREASEYFAADVKVHNLRFTLWSSFPRFCIQSDSISVISRSLDGLTPEQYAALPPNSEFLASAASLRGGINIVDLLRGHIRLHDVELDRLRLNMVSVNDSVANYLIAPPEAEETRRIPIVSANRIRLTHPEGVTFTSVAADFFTRLDLTEVGLEEVRTDTYDLTASGHISASADRLQLLSDFPFRLGGDVTVKFHPFALSLHDYSIALGNIRSHVSMHLAMGDDIRVNDFSYSTDSFHVMRLLEYLPEALIPHISGLKADMTVNASARLLTPFNLSAGTLPTVEVNFNVPDGDLVYMVDSVQPITLRHIGMTARFLFDGCDPEASYIEIPRFTLTGRDLTVDLEGRVEDLLVPSPLVNTEIALQGDIPLIASYLPSLEDWHPRGRFDISTTLSFRMNPRDSISGAVALSDLEMNGRGVIRDVAMSSPDLRASSDSVTFRFLSRSHEISPTAIRDGLADIDIAADGLNVVSGSTKVSARKVHLATGARDSINLAQGHLSAHLDVTSPSVATPSMTLRPGDLKAHLDVRHDAHPTVVPADPRYLERNQPDAIRLAALPHTPAAIALTAPRALRDLLASYPLTFTLHGAGGNMRIRGFGPGMSLGPFAFSVTPDKVAIDRFSFTCGRSSASLKGDVTGLREALLCDTPRGIHTDLDIAMDTLDINQLAHALALAAGGSDKSGHTSAENTHRRDTPDTDNLPHTPTAILLPRNLSADIRLRGRETIYTNLNLSDLNASLHMADGDVVMPGLHIGSSFGTAAVTLAYRTGDIDRMSMEASGALDNVILTRFFEKFQTIEEMFPSVRNVSGIVSLDLGIRAHVYPDMRIEMASMTGYVNATGSELKVKQNHFIHHIAEMMLIRTRKPIHIHDIALHATIHDNLLEIYPFNFEFERYHLRGEGVNNFGGVLDYHIGVLHSPIPIPFGIDIEGTYHHPHVRFGRAGWESDRATHVTGAVMKSFTINLVKDVTWFGREFMHKAAIAGAAR